MPPPMNTAGGYEKVLSAVAKFTPGKRVDDEIYGDCPICGGVNKFYINTLTGLWSCKAGKPEQIDQHTKAGGLQEGNLYDWLDCWCRFCTAEYDDLAPWEELAKDREIPIDALKDSGMAWDGEQWIFPIYSSTGTVVSLARWGETTRNKSGYREVHIFAGLKGGLFGLDLLSEYDQKAPIYLCEGPWDTMTLQYQLGDKAPVLGVPGANTFKREWLDWFAGRNVVICFDNDTAGQKGSEKAAGMLASVCQNIKQLRWPDDAPTGFDIRDYFRTGGALTELLSYISKPELPSDIPQTITFDRPFGVMSFEKEVMPIFSAYLHVTPDLENQIRIVYATVLSNQIAGDPLWVQIVAPPGGSKTEVLRTVASVENTMFLSTLTPASLVSGWKGSDPSVLPKLQNKTLVVRDLTEVLADTESNQKLTFGTLRQAYDGEVYRAYGQSVIRHYKDLWFSCLAGVTPEIFANPMASLGERFLVYHAIKGATFDDTLLVESASHMSGKEVGMREALQDISKQYLETRISPTSIPDIPEHYRRQIVYLAKLTAKLRGAVARDKYKKDILLYPPQHEIATRLVKQLSRLAICLAMLEEGFDVNERVISIVKRVATDSCNPFSWQIATLLATSKEMTPDQLSSRTNLPLATVDARLDDMQRLGAVEESKNPTSKLTTRKAFTLTDVVKNYWKESGFELKNGYHPSEEFTTEGVKPLSKSSPALKEISTKSKQSIRIKIRQ